MSLKIIKVGPEAYARICELVAREQAYEISPVELIVIEKVRSHGREDAKPEVTGGGGGDSRPEITGGDADRKVNNYFREG